MFGNRNKPEMTIIRVSENGKHVWRLDASPQHLFHLQFGIGKVQRVHHMMKLIFAYNGIVNAGLVTNDISDYFFGY